MAQIDDLNEDEFEVVDQQQPVTSIEDLDEDDIEEVGDQDISATESAIRGAAQGLTFNFADEMQAGAAALFTDKTYDEALVETREAFDKAEEANPVAFTGSEVLGGMVGFGKIGAAAKGAKALGAAAGLGAINGLGVTEEDNLEAQLSDALTGAGAGAVGLGIGKAVGKGIEAVGRATKEEARGLALKAMGIYNKSSRKGFRQTLERRGMEADEFLDAFATIKGKDGKAVLSGIKTQQDLLSDVVDTKQFTGERMGDVMKSITDQAGREIEVPMDSVGESLKRSISSKFQADPSLSKLNRAAEEIITRIDAKVATAKTIKIQEMQFWKNSLIKDFRLDKDFNKLNEVEQSFISSIDEQIESIIDAYGKPGKSLNDFKALKKDYGILAEAEKNIRRSIDADERGMMGKIWKSMLYGNAPLIGGAAMGGAVGGLSGGTILAGAALGAAMKTASRSPQLQRSTAKTLMKVGSFLEGQPTRGDLLIRLSNAAARGLTDFEKEIQIVEDEIDGKITSPQQMEALKQQVRSSSAGVRDKMRMMDEINSGRVPSEERMSQPFFRQYVPRSRDDKGRKE